MNQCRRLQGEHLTASTEDKLSVFRVNAEQGLVQRAALNCAPI